MHKLKVKNETVAQMTDNTFSQRGPRFNIHAKAKDTIQEETILDEESMSNAGDASEVKIFSPSEIAFDLEAHVFSMGREKEKN